MKRSVILTVFSLLVLAQLGLAQVPQTINHQGVLRDASGDIVDDGVYTLTFKLWSAAEGGTELWSEAQSVPVIDGIFSAVLGVSETFSSTLADFESPLWLEMWIEAGPGVTGPEFLSPRIELTAVPYAIKSRGVAGSTNVFPSNGNVGIGTNSPAENLHLVGSSGSTGNVASGTDLLIDSGDNQRFITMRGPNSGQTGILFSNSDSFLDGGLRYSPSATVGSERLEIFSGGSARLSVKGDGNVGIGTTAPSAMLDVAGDASVQGNLDVQGTITQGAPQTEYYSFSVRDANSTGDQNYLEAWVMGGAPPMTYPINITIPIHLPHGATITDITIHVDDNDGTYDAIGSLYALAGTSFTPLESSLTPITTVSSSGTGTQSPKTTLPTPHTVDNQTNIYWLRIKAEPVVEGATIRFYGGYITYTVN